MKHFKILVIAFLIVLIALPAFADRKKIKKGIGPMLSSGRISLFSNPPRYEEAMAYFDTVLTDYGPTPEAYFYRGTIFAEFASKEYEIDGKVDFFNKMTSAHDSMKLACENPEIKKNLKEKCADYQSVADSIKAGYWSTNYNEGIKLISRIDKELLPNVGNATDSATIESSRMELAAAVDSAIGFLRICAAVNTEEYRSYEAMGLVYDRNENADSALYFFTKAYEMEPSNLHLIQSIAYSHIQLKDWDNSIKFFHKVLELTPDDINTIQNMAVCFNNLQMYDSVYAYNQMAIKTDSTIASAWYDLGQLWLWRSQTYSDSTKYFKQEGIEKEANKYQSLQAAALDSSAHYYCHAAYLDSSDAIALEQCAVVTMILGNYTEAIEKFKMLTAISPQVFDFWVNLGDCYIQLQKFEQAIEPYEKALEIQSDDKKLWEVLLSLYESQGMPDKAKNASAKIKELEG